MGRNQQPACHEAAFETQKTPFVLASTLIRPRRHRFLFVFDPGDDGIDRTEFLAARVIQVCALITALRIDAVKPFAEFDDGLSRAGLGADTTSEAIVGDAKGHGGHSYSGESEEEASTKGEDIVAHLVGAVTDDGGAFGVGGVDLLELTAGDFASVSEDMSVRGAQCDP